jgi:hypothetical protein
MHVRMLAGLALALLACRSSPSVHVPAAQQAATLDVAGFEPPFEQIPIARSFIAAHRVTKLSIHELEPGTTTARSSEITEYDASGAPVRRCIRSGTAAPVLVEQITYTRDEPPPAAPGTPGLIQKVVVLDPAGRVAKVRMDHGASSVIEISSYDTAGNLIRMAREQRKPEDDGATTRYEELRTYTAGQLTRRTRGKLGEAPFETLDFSYDAGGRFSEWRGSKPGFGDDRYFFTYGPSGQLASMRFQEGPKAIYERRYTYDADGFLLRIELVSSVAAMGSATFVLAYELADGRTHQPIAVTLPAPPKQRTDADVLAALRRVFPAASAGAVKWGEIDGRPFLESITFQLPAAQLDPAVDPATDAPLKEKACTLRHALGIAECDCEYLERGSTRAGVTVVTFHVMLGC